ncbi:hypothetical protein TCAL_09724 [Tigriopus californicus]|uniref:Coiled-coil domain-containing protein 149 n=1 Tax=Tigriopus californicus TaxID=6832 RepID=A0A553P289_TIGCA|nr:uncharacterized protein LOC131883689 [Tigriopus californicus]TRY71760.1 hypothetical protein TCAL_09724 [Tigriopus californicus]|eukprot:TCALIF_09724-PA protein Name:"Similar to ccdc149 Coiled-coil domain-containing protein 149 (Xenopus laevis)" AED:0.02 eAED:0.03 QI:44/1/0.5/1/1/1/2/0/522
MVIMTSLFRAKITPRASKAPLQVKNGSTLSKSSAVLNGQDFELLDQIEIQRGENRILYQKLQSKSEALVILTKELDKTRAECEEYRILTQTLHGRDAARQIGGPRALALRTNSNGLFRDLTLTNQLGELRGENKRLLAERDQLRILVKEKEADVKLLRDELGQARNDVNHRQNQISVEASRRCQDLGILVRKLELLQLKYSRLKQDLQSLLDEKEDLVQERDAYKCKVHRLNHAMSALLKSDGYKTIDLDWLLSENQFLRESLEHVQEEKQLANDMGRKYKCALENSRHRPKPPGVKTGQEEEAQMLNDQIVALLGKTSFPCPVELNLSSTDSLQELSLSLLETLNDRMLQLKHQRRANKHIMARLEEFEHKMKNDEHGHLIMNPSQYLMAGYSAANVDEEPLHDGVDSALEDLDARIVACDLSRQSSIESSVNQSPDVSDLYKRFQAINVEREDSIYNPPDIIAEGIPRVNPPQIQAPSPIPIDPETAEANEILMEDPIVLPDHLQSLVDQAMRDLEDHDE